MENSKLENFIITLPATFKSILKKIEREYYHYLNQLMKSKINYKLIMVMY